MLLSSSGEGTGPLSLSWGKALREPSAALLEHWDPQLLSSPALSRHPRMQDMETRVREEQCCLSAVGPHLESCSGRESCYEYSGSAMFILLVGRLGMWFQVVRLLGWYTASSCGTRGPGRSADPGRGWRVRQHGSPTAVPGDSATMCVSPLQEHEQVSDGQCPLMSS